MDLLSTKWLSEMEMDDLDLFPQWEHMNSLEFPSNNMANPWTSLKSEPQVTQMNAENRVKQVDQKNWKLCSSEKAAAASSSATIISFANSDSPRVISSHDNYGNGKVYVNPDVEAPEIMSLRNIYGSLEFGNGVRKDATRNPVQAQEHVLAERKRRERMTQRFINLSALIPGLKKLDKATVLGDAIKYIKELEERVKKLEEEAKRDADKESIVSVKRPPQLCSYVDGSTSEENFDSSSNHSLPEIEVRASEGNVLVRVYCKNQTGIIKEIISEIERNHLIIASSSTMPFGDNRLYITIIAQMADHEYKITAKTLVDSLMAIANLT